jgi:preprotein translocase subunit SecF
MSMQNVINTWVVIFLAFFIYQNIQLKSDIAKLSEANNYSKLIKLQEKIDRLDLMISSADAKSNQNEDNIKKALTKSKLNEDNIKIAFSNNTKAIRVEAKNNQTISEEINKIKESIERLYDNNQILTEEINKTNKRLEELYKLIADLHK